MFFTLRRSETAEDCHSDHLFVYLTFIEDIAINCGDTIDTIKVARVNRNTNDALVVV